MACHHGSQRVVEFLLGRKNIDVNKRIKAEGRPPLLIAAAHGFHEILKLFKKCPKSDFSVIEEETEKTVLHEVFRYVIEFTS